jgi:methylated-DNA-[protein]-cysteine S-methyltransferase
VDDDVIVADEVESPIGKVIFAVRDGKICALGFEEHWPTLEKGLERRLGGVELVRRNDPEGFSERLRAYFRGDVATIDSIPVDPAGTPFQLQVWSALREIPCGRTLSYGELARVIGKPESVRAVGAANGQNPISIVVPCHRVIGADGKLIGYGGGIERKRWLLAHEKALLA